MEALIFIFLISSCVGQYVESKTNADEIDGTFLQAGAQCYDYCAKDLCEYAVVMFKWNESLAGSVENTLHCKKKFLRKSDARSDANETSVTEKNDGMYVRDSSRVCIDLQYITMLGVVVLVLCVFCIISLFTWARRLYARRPQVTNTREERASQEQRRHPMPKDSLERKEFVETPIAESSETNDTNRCRTVHENSFQEQCPTQEQQKTSPSADLQEVSNSQIQNGIRELKERMVCKICLSRKMCIVFLPCNHMVTCEHCSVMLDRCAVCRTVIKGTLAIHTQF